MADVIRNVRIVGRSEGLDTVTGQLNKLGQAHGALTVVTDRSARASLGLESALEKSRRQFDETYRAQVRMRQAQEPWNRALAAGTVTGFEHGRMLDLIAQNCRVANVAQDKLAVGFGRLGGATAGVGGNLRAFGGGLISGVVISELMQLPGVIGDVVESTAGMVDSAAKIGTTTDALQELRHAGQLAGVDFGEMDSALAQFSRRTAQAAAGTGPLVDILKANQVELRSVDGAMRPLTDLLGDYANLVKGAASEQDQLNLSTEGFGRGGGGMVNLLRGGADALERARQEAHDFGGVLDRDLAEAAARVDDKFDRLSMRVGTFFKSAVLEAVGAMDMLIERFNSLGEASGEELNRRLGSFQSERAVMLSEIERLGQYPTGPGGRMDPIAAAELERVKQRLAELDAQLAAVARVQAGATAGFRGVGGYGYPPAITLMPTVIPNKADAAGERAREKSISDIERQRQAVRDLISDLEFENSLVGKSATEQRIANALRQAGAAATDQQREAIRLYIAEAAAVEEAQRRFDEAQREAQREAIERMDEVRGMLSGVLTDANRAIREGADVWEAFGDSALNVLGRIEDRLLGMVEQNFIEALLGKEGELGGGVLGAWLGRRMNGAQFPTSAEAVGGGLVSAGPIGHLFTMDFGASK